MAKFSFEEGLGVVSETSPPLETPNQPQYFPFEEALVVPETAQRFSFEEALAPVIPTPVVPTPVTPAPVEVEDSIFRETADIPLKLTSGAITGVKMATDLFGANNVASEALGTAQNWVNSFVSAQSKADSQEIARLLKEAEDFGFGGQARAAFNALKVAPLDFLAEGVGTIVPAIAAAVYGGLAGVTAYGIGSGAGLVKDTIYTAVRDQFLTDGKTEKEAEEAAKEAQAYAGENLDMIMGGGALGYLATRFGVPEIFLKGQLTKNLLQGAVREGVPEALQGGQEAISANLALQRQGFDVPIGRGVASQAVLEGTIGSLIGGAANVATSLAPLTESDETTPEWSPVVNALVGLDLAKTETEQLERANELQEEYGEEAYNAYLAGINAEQPSVIAEEASELDINDARNSEFLESLETERDLNLETEFEFDTLTEDELLRERLGDRLSKEEIIGSSILEEQETDEEDASEDASEEVVSEEVVGEEDASEDASGEVVSEEVVSEEVVNEISDPLIGSGIDDELVNDTADPLIGKAIIDLGNDPFIDESNFETANVTESVISKDTSAGNQVDLLTGEEIKVRGRGRPEGTGVDNLEFQQQNKIETAKRNAIRARERNASSRLIKNTTSGPTNRVNKIFSKKTYQEFFPNLESFTSFIFEEELQAIEDAYAADLNTASTAAARYQGEGARSFTQELESVPELQTTQDTGNVEAATSIETEEIRKKYEQQRKQLNRKRKKYNALQEDIKVNTRKSVEELQAVIEITENPRYKSLANDDKPPATYTAALEALAAVKDEFTAAQYAQAEDNAKSKYSSEPLAAIPVSEIRPTDFSPLTTAEGLSFIPETVTTAEEVAEIITLDRNRVPFERGLARLFKPLLKAMGTKFVQVASDRSNLPPAMLPYWTNSTGEQIASGLYDPVQNVIYIDPFDGASPRTVLHEMIHAVTVNVLNQAINNPDSVSDDVTRAIEDMNSIMNAISAQYQSLFVVGRTTPAMDRYAENTANFSDLKEFVAYGLTAPTLQAMMLSMPSVVNQQIGVMRTAFANFSDTVRRLIGRPTRDRSAFEDLIDLTGRLAAENITTSANARAQAQQAKKKAKKLTAVAKRMAATKKLRDYQKGMGQLVSETRDPVQGVKDFITFVGNNVNAGRAVLEASLGALTNTMLLSVADYYGVTGARKVDKIIEDIGVYRTRAIKKVKPLVRDWQRLYITKGMSTEDKQKVTDTAENLENVIHISSIEEVEIFNLDSNKFNTRKQAETRDTQLNGLEIELRQLNTDPNASLQEIAAVERDIEKRKTVISETFDLFDRVKTGKNGASAARLYGRTMQEYRNDLDELHRLITEYLKNDKVLPGDVNDPDSPKGKVFADVQLSYQEAKKRRVYAPLMRYGKFFVRLKTSENGKTEFFYMFETKGQATRFARREKQRNLEEGNGKYVIQGTLGDGTSGTSLQEEMMRDNVRLSEIFTNIELAEAGMPGAGDALKQSIYEMYLLSLPEGNIRRKYLSRKGIDGYSNDALRNLVNTKLSTINQMARLNFGGRLRTAVSEMQGTTKGVPDKLDIELSTDPEVKKEVPLETQEAIIGEVAKRSEGELSPIPPEGLFGKLDRASQMGTRASFFYMMSAARSALIQPFQVIAFGLPVLHSEYGVKNTGVMAAKYLKNTLLMRNFNNLEFDENGNIVDNATWLDKNLAVRNSKYVQNSPIKNALHSMWDYADDRNLFTTGRVQQATESATPSSSIERAQGADATASTEAKKVGRFLEQFATAATQFTERVSREVFYMSAAELEYEKQIKAGTRPDLAVEIASTKAVQLTKSAMFDYSPYNKPRLAKNLGRMAYQFQNYRVQALGFIFKNFLNMLPSSGLSKTGKKKAAIKFFDTMGIGLLTTGTKGFFGYAFFTAFLQIVREVMRPDFDDEDSDLYRGTRDPNNPLNERSVDVYWRNSTIPRWFGPESAFSKKLGLSDEAARKVELTAEYGALAALTNANVQPSLGMDGLWYNEYKNQSSGNLYDDLVMELTELIGGPTAGLVKNFSDGLVAMQEGEYLRGVEKLSPGIISQPLEAVRMSREGYVTRGDRVLATKEYFDPYNLAVTALGFTPTELAYNQNRIYGQQDYDNAVKEERKELYDDLNKTVQEKADNNPEFQVLPEDIAEARKVQEEYKENMDDIIQRILEFNYKHYKNQINIKDIRTSVKGRARNRGLTEDGFYYGDDFGILILNSLNLYDTSPTPDE